MARGSKSKIRSKTRIVGAMATVMHRDFRNGVTPSPFAYEGMFRAALRSSLCLAGWRWDIADQAARDVVGEALRQINAQRPPWTEGQRDYVRDGSIMPKGQCRECGKALEGRQETYCSAHCKNAYKWRFYVVAAA